MADGMLSDDRGVSEVIGFVLVFALILGTVIYVSTTGLAGLEGMRAAEQVDNAERAFDVVAENIADIYRHGAPSRTTEIDLGGASLSLTEPIVMNVSNGSTVLARQEITPIVYSAETDERIVYAGGGTFRTTEGDGVVIREPPFSISADSAHLTVVGTRSRATDTVSGGTIRLRADRSAARLPAFDTDGTHGTLWMNITSPRWAVWQSTLEGPHTSCLSGTETASDVVACELYPNGTPDRVAVSLVQIDVAIST